MKIILTLLIGISTIMNVFSQDIHKSFGLTFVFNINNYAYYDYELQSRKNNFGLGMAAALFYQKAGNKFSLNAGFISDSPMFLMPVEYAKKGTRTTIIPTYIEFLYHRQIFKKVNLIGGVNRTYYNYNFISYVDSLPPYEKHSNNTGITLGAEYNITNYISVAFLYRKPLNNKNYGQMLSLDGRFNLHIWKK